MASTGIDKEINSFLPQLSVKQKKAVLTVVKTFAEEQYEEISEYSEDFKKDLDERYDEYINGGKLVSEADANKRISKIINGKIKK